MSALCACIWTGLPVATRRKLEIVHVCTCRTAIAKTVTLAPVKLRMECKDFSPSNLGIVHAVHLL